jgi:hypothetical protein
VQMTKSPLISFCIVELSLHRKVEVRGNGYQDTQRDPPRSVQGWEGAGSLFPLGIYPMARSAA